jgi:hypothetical protein
MPKSEIWKGVNGQSYGVDIEEGVYRYEKNSGWGGSGSFSPPDENGTGSAEIAFITYFNNATHEGVIFPAAGLRLGGSLYDVGVVGYYWSSSVFDATSAYYLYFNLDSVSPDDNIYRPRGFPVRCVQEL